MKSHKRNAKKKTTNSGLVAVAVNKDKGSQYALKWAVDHLVSRGQTIILINVINKSSSASGDINAEKHKQAENLFLTFHCYCSLKEIQCFDVTLEDVSVVKSIVEYVSSGVIENLVLGAPRGFMRKFKMSDTPSNVAKAAPEFCTVYIISKEKISSIRNATRAAPYKSPLLDQIENHSAISNYEKFRNTMSFKDRTPTRPSVASSNEDYGKSPLARASDYKKSFYDFPDSDSDISFISDRPSTASSGRSSTASSGRPSTTSSGRPSTTSSGRPSTSTLGRSDISFASPSRLSTNTTGSSSFMYEFPDSGLTPRLSTGSGQSFGSFRLGTRFNDNIQNDLSFVSQDSSQSSCSCSPQNLDEVEAEMQRLKQELKRTMDMYGSACREALAAKQEAKELQRHKSEEEGWVQGQLSEKSTKSIIEKERANKAAKDASETASRIAELETQRRAIEAGGSFTDYSLRSRRYAIGEIEEATNSFDEANKIGEGGYGTIFKGHLDHTPVAVKVLRPDAAQGRAQFQREVEILSCIRHPHIMLLIGACPEYGVLVYEYMAKGSLADRLHRKGNMPPLSWELRFRIAAEVATGLLFLHQTKPEPIVHSDLKPENILIDQNYVSKIGDVGLAKLVPAVAENVTQSHVTSSDGTSCYIDPEYQQTGVLGVKSDVYSFGIMLLELLTAKNPKDLDYAVAEAIEQGTFNKMLDSSVHNWPVEEALSLAKIALKCAQPKRNDRPELGKEVLPELNKLRALADANMEWIMFNYSRGPSRNHSQVSLPTVDEIVLTSDSSDTDSSTESYTEKKKDEEE